MENHTEYSIWGDGVLIKDIEFLKGLSKVEQARLLGSMDEEEFTVGSILFRQGDKGDCMYIVTRGTIELTVCAEDGSECTLAFIGEGEVLGEMAMLTDSPRTATATVVNNVTLFKMGAETFNKLIDENISLSLYLSRLLSRRLAHSNTAETLKMRLVMDDMQKLPADLQKVILFATTVPSCSIKFLTKYFELAELSNKITLDGDICAKVMFWKNEDDLLSINSDVKDNLKEVYNQKYNIEEKGKFISAAVQNYVTRGKFTLAVQTYVDNFQWDEACKLVQDLKQTIPSKDPIWTELMNFFQGCPDDSFFQHLDIFVLFLKVFLDHNQEVGYNKLEDILFEATYSFNQEQKVVLYELAAEFCKKLGYKQKALEYLNTAISIAATFETQRSEESADGQGNTYELAKRNVLGALGNAKAEKARRFIFEKNKLTAVSLIAFSVLVIGYFSHTAPVLGLSREAMSFLGISIAAVAFWVVNIVPAFIVSLLMVLIWVLGGIVKPETALSGFGTPVWFYMLGILAFSTAISKSGLLYRVSLHILKVFPKSYFGQLLGLAVCGLIFTPLIPSASAKAALGSSISQSISDSMNFPDRSKGSAGMGLCAMIFFAYLVPFFLTGTYTNVFAMGLIPSGMSISWFQWLFYASPALLVFMIGMFASIYVMNKPNEINRQPSCEVINQQLKILGKFTREEIITAFVAVTVIAMLMLQSFHKVDSTWVMLAGFITLVIGGVLDNQTLKNGIDWPFLLFMGIAFSFVKVLDQLGIVGALTVEMTEIMKPFTASPYLFLPVLTIVIFIISFIINDDPAVILFVVSLAPMFQQLGIHPWILIFIVMVATAPFFFPYQSPIYLIAYYNAGEKAFTHKQGQKLSLIFALVTVISIIASIPFWQYIGLII